MFTDSTPDMVKKAKKKKTKIKKRKKLVECEDKTCNKKLHTTQDNVDALFASKNEKQSKGSKKALHKKKKRELRLNADDQHENFTKKKRRKIQEENAEKEE